MRNGLDGEQPGTPHNRPTRSLFQAIRSGLRRHHGETILKPVMAALTGSPCCRFALTLTLSQGERGLWLSLTGSPCCRFALTLTLSQRERGLWLPNGLSMMPVRPQRERGPTRNATSPRGRGDFGCPNGLSMVPLTLFGCPNGLSMLRFALTLTLSQVWLSQRALHPRFTLTLSQRGEGTMAVLTGSPCWRFALTPTLSQFGCPNGLSMLPVRPHPNPLPEGEGTLAALTGSPCWRFALTPDPLPEGEGTLAVPTGYPCCRFALTLTLSQGERGLWVPGGLSTLR